MPKISAVYSMAPPYVTFFTSCILNVINISSVLAIVKRILWNISSHIAGGEISGEIEGVSDFENMERK
jgi:hypothetical protein